jgi:hypothetical protein
VQVNKNILRVLYIALVSIISIPAVMFILRVQSPGKPLKGVVQETGRPTFSFASFYNHKYQFQLSNYLDSRFPFEASFIRLYNQIEFSVFNNIINEHVTLGKNGVLFEPWYIDSYYGKDFVGEEYIQDQVDKLAALDSVFRKNGKTLIIALAPGKANVYPEFIPDYLKRDSSAPSNYGVYAQMLKEKKLNVLDFNEWFIKLKLTFERNLFPKGGTHWSEDMALVSLDTLIRYIECKSGDFLNNINLTEISHTNIPQGSDDDLIKISNLVAINGYSDYYYWNYTFENRFPVDKTLITISDSYFWNMYARGLSLTFKSPKFWYYYNNAYFDKEPETLVSELDINEQIKEADYIMLMSSPSPLNKFGWGFIDEAYCRFVENEADLVSSTRKANLPVDKSFQNCSSVSKEIAEIIKNIKADPAWYQLIKDKANERRISVDSLLILDAIYMLENK